MRTHHHRPASLALLAVALLVSACGSTTPTGSPTPSLPSSAASPAPAGSSSPPASASPSPSPSSSGSASSTGCDAAQAASSPVAASPDTGDPNAALYSRIEQQVVALRGITPTKPLERGVFDKPALCAYIAAGFEQDNPPALITGTERLYRALNLMPQDASLRDLYIELLTSQVAGLYDDKTKKMYVVSTTGEIGPAEEVAYAHEYTHALQDQRFDLKRVTGDAKDQGDRTMARTTLVEGDATLLQLLWAQTNLTPQQLAQVAGAADPASEAILAKMPGILKDPLLFPYTTGLQVTLAAFQSAGGYAGVDPLFAKPPDTTEQVMHPDKLASREPAIPVAFPAGFPGSLGTGWKLSLQDTLGEFQLGILLRDGAGSQASTAAAQGWGGDRVAWVEGPGGANAAVIDTRWDTPADAAEFAAALSGYAARLKAIGRTATILTPAPDRVVVVSASDADTMGRVANVLGLAG